MWRKIKGWEEAYIYFWKGKKNISFILLAYTSICFPRYLYSKCVLQYIAWLRRYIWAYTGIYISFNSEIRIINSAYIGLYENYIVTVHDLKFVSFLLFVFGFCKMHCYKNEGCTYIQPSNRSSDVCVCVYVLMKFTFRPCHPGNRDNKL